MSGHVRPLTWIREGLERLAKNGLSPGARVNRSTVVAVMAALTRRANGKDGEFFASQEDLARLSGVSTRSVRFALQELAEVGLLERLEKGSRTGHRASTYALRLSDERCVAPVITPRSPEHRSDGPSKSPEQSSCGYSAQIGSESDQTPETNPPNTGAPRTPKGFHTQETSSSSGLSSTESAREVDEQIAAINLRLGGGE